MRIYFIRHGQTDCNLQGIIQGQKDFPLNDWGRKEAQRLAKRLAPVRFDEMWSSSLSRAKETADIVASLHPGVVVHTEPLLMERNLGSMEGQRGHKGYKVPEDAESSEALQDRGRQWFRAFLNDTLKNGDDKSEYNVLVMSHGAYLGMLRNILVLGSKDWKFEVASGVDLHASCGNTMIMLVDVHRRVGKAGYEGVIHSWGDNTHLDGMKEPNERKLRVADDVQ